MAEGSGVGKMLGRVFLCSFGSVLSLVVLLVAIVWGWREESALRPGKGVDVPHSLHGYNVVITGSTSGIGFDAALEFFKLRAHVLVHSSDQQRAAKSAEEIKRLGDGKGRVTPMAGNLGKFDDIRRLAKEIQSVMPRVDILILNACRMYGLAPVYNDDTLLKQPDSVFKVESGHDTVLAVNHLGHFLLTELLLPLLPHGATIVIMSASGAWDSNHGRIMPPWGNIGKHKMHPTTANSKRILWESKGLKQHAYKAYHDSKLANVCHGRWLRRRLARNATVIIHDPGFVITTPMTSRDSVKYKERHYRRVKQTKLKGWHGPVQDAGRHMLQAAFVTRRPVPDFVTAYFFPRQLISWIAPLSWEDTQWRAWSAFQFQNHQKLTWGLHAGVGPECGEELQDRFAEWSAREVGLSV